MKQVLGLAIVLASFVFVSSCKTSQYADLGDGIYANIETNKGDMIIKFTPELTPVTVANFVSLAEGNSPFVSDTLKNKPYYDGLIFHRVIKDFMIQGGDPTGTGRGTPGYRFKDEFHDSLTHHKKGILSMANSGVKTNGSQFFITHKETPFLDKRHTVFGEVIKGIEVIDSIVAVKTNPKDRPLEDIVMKKVSIIRNGKKARNWDAVEIMSSYFEKAKVEEEKEKQRLYEQEQEKKRIESLKKQEFEAQKKSATALPSGLKIHYIKKGDGPKPRLGQYANIFYAGYFENGKLFDSNIEDIAVKNLNFNQTRKDQGGYNPFPMQCSMDAKLIAGFKEALMQMRVGDKIRAFIPSHLGYGSQGQPMAGIKPNQELIFELEMMSLAK
ncbi:MAG: peptidylprolyl isomerase [Flavobacteriaceae bacterium]|nr:peptidylprolyl isomerase [Flavobacteriaceae bacterium]